MTPLSSHIKHTFLTIALATTAFLPCKVNAEVAELVTAANISATTPINSSHNPSNLLSDNDTKYHTLDDYPGMTFADGDQYLQVDLSNTPLNLADDEDLIVFVQRCHTCIVRQPTAFRVEGFLPGPETETNPESGTWEHICNIYFLYRGRNTKEYSARIHPKNGYTKLRFYVTDNNSRNYDDDGHASMGLRQFQVYQLGRNETVGDRIDPVHLSSDYKKDYYDYYFEHTMGWLDRRNRDSSKTLNNQPAREDWNYNNEAWSKGTLAWQQEYINKINDWASWSTVWDANGKWQLDNAELTQMGVRMPDMSLITKDEDFTATAEDPCRQPTHVSEHILYALPGDPIILYPYYKFANPKHYEQYEVNFAHWYDYRTGGRIIYDDKKGNQMDLLDFIADPSQICITDKNGFYGAYLLTEKDGVLPGLDSRNYGMFATFFCPRKTEGADALTLPFRACDKAQANSVNDIDEFVIAADFSQSFNKGRNLDEVNKKIIEPTIAFRHIFRIRDAKKFADEFSGSAQANIDYIETHTRRVTARANKGFQIGLEGAVPKPIEDEGWWRSVPSKYYYKVKDNDYRRIVSMAIRVTDPDGNVTTYSHQEGHTDPFNPTNKFYFDAADGSNFKGLGSRTIDNTFYGIAGGGVCDEDIVYCRLLKNGQQLSGHYTVEILGEEIIGRSRPSIIKVAGSDRDLVVMKYDINFVENEDSADPQALFVKGVDLYNIYKNNNDKYKFAREAELVAKYGDPKDKVDFDYYRGLENLGNSAEYLNGEDGKYSYKWPVMWKASNYGFGYADGHNYNIYAIANNSSKLKWKQIEDIRDMLYWKATNLPKNNMPATRADEETTTPVENNNGYFLYVNAANDPGVMITLNAGTLCTGSTINVSAWVVEVSNESEKANLAFNLVAVLAGTGERINVHTFVSGYVPSAGEWYNIFYSFQPDVDKIGYTSAQIDHYELELENNCKSSDGADYAIDDIAIYIVTPVIGAESASPVCWDLNTNGTNTIDKAVKIYAPFSETLRSIGLSEAKSATDGKDVKLSYLILDRKKYDAAYKAALAANSSDPEAAAMDADGVKLQNGSINFNSYFEGNNEYAALIQNGVAGRYLDDRGTKMIAFNVNFNDPEYAIGKEYYIAIHTQESGENINPSYDLHDPCAKTCIFKVSGKNDVRLNGTVVTKSGPIKVCEGERAKITVDVKTEGGAVEKVEIGALCDWFKGTKAKYDAIDGLYRAMVYFREVYPRVEDPEDATVAAGDMFTQEMHELILAHKDKFIFNAAEYDFGIVTKSTDNVVTALPIPFTVEGDQVVCTAPMEITIEVLSPSVLHGLRDVEYPAGMEDVPLRAGLDQLKQTVIIPLRKVQASGVVKEVKTLGGTGVVTLESTNDPNPEFNSETMTSSTGEKYVVKPEIEAGEIKYFTADLQDGSKNQFSVKFDDSFQFREGYEYTFSYVFNETMPEGEDHICKGKDIFTIKVVPEFLVWSPVDGNRNWNNDANWKRVGSDVLLAEFETDAVKTRLNDKVTDGSNSNEGAFVPMDFTKVIIPATNVVAKAPFMYEFQGIDGGKVVPAASGDPTEDIEYDMVAVKSGDNIGCGLWYANICEQIHFEPNASIMNQQHLEYKKAWIDLELTPYRWYTLAMPLKKVFAGEFYLPSDNARQQTELFQPITYDETKNNRFNPAVFQRGWDKGEALIYHPNKDATSAVVKANWSHVYNDVEESYGSGNGFSIKADVSHVENTSDKVLFRLPKSDESYGYYDNEGNELNTSKRKDIDHGDYHYRLNEANGTISASTAGDRYFLVGNPFMTHLDMKNFLDANKEKVELKYWMITDGTQKMGVFDESSEGFVGNAEGYVAPMQGFFVEAVSEVKSLELSYDETMMYDASGEEVSAPLKIATRGYGEGLTLTISALNDDEESTAAVVRVAPEATSDYIAEEDMVVIDNSDLEVRATVYTVSGGKALSVNALDGVDNIEVGLIALPEEETLLRFNLGNDCPLNLYDAETGAYTPIFDGMTYPVSGSVAGRLYLTASSHVKTVEASKINWSTSGDELTVRSSDAGCSRLSVRIIDYAGRVVAARSVEGCEVTLPIAAGVYVLEAETESERICLQVKI